jgi:tetratricopeptide (TPR) repeat protein
MRVGALRLSVGIALALFAGATSLSCAAVSGPQGSGSMAGLTRPDLGVEYDVLVGELAIRDGDFLEARGAFERAIEKDPDSAALQFKLARIAAQLDDGDAAVLHAERGLALDPGDEAGRLFLGRLHRIRRDVAGVERALRDAEGRPVSGDAALLLNQVYLEQGRLDEALAVSLALLEAEPENLGAYMALATVYERQGRFDEAEGVLRQALDLQPDRFVLYSRLARMRRARSDGAGEIALYREVLVRHPGHYATLISLGEAQIMQNDLEGAIATYSDIVSLFPDDVQAIRRLASLEYGVGRHEQSAQRLRDALGAHPQHHEFAFSLGQVLRGLGREEEALEAFAEVPASHPLYVESRMQIASILESEGRLAEALVEVDRLRALRPERGLDFHAASLRARSGDLAGGVALLQKLLAENPDDDEVLYQLGVVYGLGKDADTALGYMQRSLDANPDNAHALNYIGYTWAERGERLDEAEALIQRALEISPNDGYIADSLGWVYYMRARPLMGTDRRADGVVYLEKARSQLDLAVELTGGDPVIAEHLGDVYRLLDQKERALQYYREAVEMDHREDEQPELLEKLDELRRELESGEVGAPAPESTPR